ncbi:MAG: MAPEG family protein [Myxococcales bacterium]|nr:MAPEG family protein [Myxococcales bacterium]
MTFELTILVGSAMLGLLHIVLVAQLSNYHRGYVKWAAGARDEPPEPLPRVAARIERAYRNYLETYPYFVAVTLTAQALGVHSWQTEWGTALFLGSRVLYVGLYAAGVWLLRSLVWNVAYGGIALVIIAVLRSA